MLKVERAAWEPTRTVVFDERHFRAQMEVYPQGQLVLEQRHPTTGSEIIGILNSRKGNKNEISQAMTWGDCADSGWIRNHDARGTILYPINESFLPTAESLGGIGLLEGLMMALAVREGCSAIVFGSRIPRLAAFNRRRIERGQPALEGRDYATRTRPNGRFYDPLIAKFMTVPFMEYLEVLEGYYDDPESENFAALMAFHNPLYLYRLTWVYTPILRRTVGKPVLGLLAWLIAKGG
jgi:hypothetical protein